MNDKSIHDLFPIAEGDLARLKSQLALQAEATELLDVSYRTIDSPIGELLMASTAAGLVRVAFANEGFDAVLQTLSDRLGPRILSNPRPLDHAATELDEYFEGQRETFDLPLDYSLSSGFRRRVQQFLPHIPYGRTSSYGKIAEEVGNPRAVRAVGSACATNPLPIVIPCHRVLRSDGSLGGYLGGLDAKRILLDLEYSA